MARRAPKPFTVEVRRGGRIAKSGMTATPSMADLIRDADRPHVTAWPGTDQEPAGSPQTAEPTPPSIPVPSGRVLPVLVDPKPRGGAAEAKQPSPPRRRHRPAVPGLKIESTWPDDDEAVDDIEPADTAEREEPEIEVDQLAPTPAIDAKTIAATMLLRQDRVRLPRDAFKREGRWKARLPAAAHRTRKRGS